MRLIYHLYFLSPAARMMTVLVLLLCLSLISPINADLTSDELSLIVTCAQLSYDVYNNNNNSDNNQYFYRENSGSLDAYILRETSDTCITAFRGTDVATCLDLNTPCDLLQNANTNPVPMSNIIAANDDEESECWVAEGYYNAYHDNRSGETMQVDLETRLNECVDKNKKLIFTGHSQGGAVAQIAAFRYYGTTNNLHVYTFGSVPAFYKNKCDMFPDSAVTNIINTELDYDWDALEMDQIPFYADSAPYNSNYDHKGEWYVLTPHKNEDYYFTSMARVEKYQDMINPDKSNLIGPHSMRDYLGRLQTYAQQAFPIIPSDGFPTWTWCSDDWTCQWKCTTNGYCTEGYYGEPCWYDSQCIAGRRCKWWWSKAKYLCT